MKKFSLKDNPIFKNTVVPQPGRSEKEAPSSDDTSRDPIKESEREGINSLPGEIPERAPKIARRIFLGAAASVLVAIILLSYWGLQTTSRSHRQLPVKQEERLLRTKPIIRKDETIKKKGQFHRREVKPVERREVKRKPLLLPGKEKLGRKIISTSSSQEGKTASIVQKKREKQERKEWALTAIIYNETSSRAIINHEIVQAGDTLPEGETKVIKIMPDRVILSRGGETFTLRLGATIPREEKTGEKQDKQGMQVNSTNSITQ